MLKKGLFLWTIMMKIKEKKYEVLMGREGYLMGKRGEKGK